MEKITKREMFTAIAGFVQTGELQVPRKEGVLMLSPEQIVEFAEKEIALLDKKALKSKEIHAKKRAESDELKDAVLAALTDEFEPIAEIAARTQGEGVTASKVTYRLTALTKAGLAEKAELSITTEEGKKRKAMGYRLKSEEPVVEE